MFVNEITEILNIYAELPYRCIFFNGSWGIGKSYAVDHVRDKEKVVRVSLSGAKSSEEVYSEILDGFVGKAGFTQVIGKVVKSTVGVASQFDSTKIPAGVATNVADAFLTYKNAVRIYFARQRSLRIIILDDFERVWDGIDITDVFRVVDFLVNQKNVKVVLVGDLSKLQGVIKDKFALYSERYIDKIYNITDIANNIDWASEPLYIDTDFITEFRSLHSFTNLRSVIKANDFYKELRLALIKKTRGVIGESGQFWKDIRLTAFAIVIESIDKLKVIDDSKTIINNPKLKAKNELENQLDSRVRKYLMHSRLGCLMLPAVLEFFQTNTLQIETFERIYLQSLEKERPAYLFTSAEVVSQDLPEIEENVYEAKTVSDLVSTTRDYIQLCNIVGINTKSITCVFKQRLQEMIVQLINNNISDVFDTSYFTFALDNNEELKDIVKEEFANAKEMMINHLIDYLLGDPDTQEKYDMAKRLSDYSYDSYYEGMIKKRLDDIVCDKIFPIDAHSTTAFYACVIMMKLVDRMEPQRLEEYYYNIMRRDIDAVAKHRCTVAMKNVREE